MTVFRSLVDAVLQEKFLTVLYHATTLDSFLHMVDTDEIELSSSRGSGREKSLSRGRKSYLSTANVKYGNYAQLTNKEKPYDKISVVLVLTGDLLSRDFPVVPVSYHRGRPEDDEQESRVMADVDFISLSKYTTAAHVNLELANQEDIEAVMDDGPHTTFPIYYYGPGEEQWWMTQRPKRDPFVVPKHYFDVLTAEEGDDVEEGE